ncbi:MAG TPA: FliH/SctL family protein [Afipia sp.]
MSAPAKFLFDMDFAAPAAAKERPATSAEIAVRIAEAEARAYRNGFDAAQHEAKVESDRRSALALEQIGISIRQIASSFGNIENRMETEAVDVAVAVARKLCHELMSAEPMTEVMALVSDCFRHLTSTPHLAIRINDDLYETAKEQIEALARRSGFEGRLVILAEPDIAAADCKIEWADGGCVLERAAIEAKIDELVGRYIATRNQARNAGSETRMETKP